MDWRFPLGILIGSVVTWAMRSFFESYLKTKGEHLATKQDIEEITRKVEGVKSEISIRLELIKLELGKKATIHRLAAEKEFAALTEIGKALDDLQGATSLLRPSMDRVDPNEPLMERHNRRYRDWVKSFDLFRDAFQKPRMFLPTSLYREFIKIHQLSRKEAIGFEMAVRHKGTDGHLDLDDYQQGQKNVDEMNGAIDNALAAIRKRLDVDG